MRLDNIKNLKSSNGFTLAEVLITLVIIGIIAAMTVPTLIKKTNNQEYVARVKKSYSTLQQAFYKLAMKKGCSIGDLSFVQDGDFFTLFIQELNAVKICKVNYAGCFYPNSYKSLRNVNWDKYDLINSLVTADGVAYGWQYSRLCTNKGLTTEDQENCVGRFIVDVNGHKGPNKFGRDVYFFMAINGKGIIPAGSGNDSEDCRVDSNGITCAAKIIKENAMNY